AQVEPAPPLGPGGRRLGHGLARLRRRLARQRRHRRLLADLGDHLHVAAPVARWLAPARTRVGHLGRGGPPAGSPRASPCPRAPPLEVPPPAALDGLPIGSAADERSSRSNRARLRGWARAPP